MGRRLVCICGGIVETAAAATVAVAIIHKVRKKMAKSKMVRCTGCNYDVEPDEIVWRGTVAEAELTLCKYCDGESEEVFWPGCNGAEKLREED